MDQRLEAVRWGRGPRGEDQVNPRIVCADGFMVSVQASPRCYAQDATGRPYWQSDPVQVAYPFTTVEVGYPSEEITSRTWRQYDSGGVWAWVPVAVVDRLIRAHGGSVGWEVADS